MKSKFTISILTFLAFIASLGLTTKCVESIPQNEIKNIPMIEKQITFSAKSHALDNNDNFSPDGKFLCYDTRGTVYNENLANSKSIEKVEMTTGIETVLWKPEFVTGEEAAPGVAAVSYHPIENKVIFIHGPNLDEVEVRGYYDIRNRTAIEVDGDGNKTSLKVDLRDISNEVTTPGAQRGGTHRHEYSRNSERIGFTYDDFLVQDYDRTIGYMQADPNSPEGYSHYFSVILKPAKKGMSKAGEIEKAYGDSWVDTKGSMRAFIGKVRAENGVDYENDLFIANIPLNTNITTSSSGTSENYPEPPEGITIQRLTTGMNLSGIVRGSMDGENITFIAEDEGNINQAYVINLEDKLAVQATKLPSSVSNIRWHPTGKWIIFISDGNIYATYTGDEIQFGTTLKLTETMMERDHLVVSQDGNLIAYVIPKPTKDTSGEIVRDANDNNFRQIFTLSMDWKKINAKVKISN